MMIKKSRRLGSENVENIKRVILKYRDLIPKRIINRDLKIRENKLKKAIVIIGPRRSGKTYYLYSLINKKYKQKKEKNFVFINFDDGLVSNITLQDLIDLPIIARELLNVKEGEDNKLEFYFDEIQNLNDWEKLIVSLLNSNYKIYITGSNSRLLSKEIASSLRGKSLNYLLLPLSFKEFLRFNNFKTFKNIEYTDKVGDIKKYFRMFLKYGGFPEVALVKDNFVRNKLITNYFDTILYKDIVDRLGIKNTKLVEVTLNYLLNNFSNIFSISKYMNYLKSNNIPYSLEDIYKILNAAEDVFFVSFTRNYKKSFKKREVSKTKVYLLDQGYIHFLALESNDYGRILENVVFIELFRKIGNPENKNIFYFKNNHECDFLVIDKGRVKEAIQVTYKLSDRNYNREVKGLVEALKKFNLKKGLLLTYDQEDKIVVESKEIIVKPVWKWLLGL